MKAYDISLFYLQCFYFNLNESGNSMIGLPCILNFICKGNLIAKSNCLDEINWPNHLRMIKVIKFTKAESQ